MLTDAEVLAKLGGWISPGELQGLLRKLLRVPEAWDLLHATPLLERALSPDAEKTLSPAGLPATAYDWWPEPFEAPLPEPIEEKFTRLESQIESDFSGPENFEEVALLSLALQRELRDDDSLAKVSGRVLAKPSVWQSPLACAWAHFDQGDKFLNELLRNNRHAGILLVANVLLANMDPEEAAARLLAIAPPFQRAEHLSILSIHEPDYAQSFARAIAGSGEVETVHASGSFESQLAAAIASRLSDDLQTARQSLQSVHQTATHLFSRALDEKAEIARLLGDIEGELETRHQAADILNSPERRANLALAQARKSSPEAGFALLADPPTSLEEKIAGGLLWLQMGDSTQAREIFTSAANRVTFAEPDNPSWLSRLTDGLLETGETNLALHVSKLRAERSPGDALAYIDLAEILKKAGDNFTASNVAYVALTLFPDSQFARQTLASSLQAAGHPEHALIHWHAIANITPDVLPDLARCALEAGDINLAKQTALDLLEKNPDSLQAQILLGRALAAGGEYEKGRQLLEEATQIAPDLAEAWIALAEVQESAGDHEAAGQTLAAAIQLNPADPDLQFAYSQWLQGQGKVTDSLEAVEKAWKSNPKNVKYQIAYGDLLRTLGHHEEALPVLRSAIAAQPANWEALQALAQTYESRGELSAAARLFDNMTDYAPAEVQYTAGRLSIKTAEQKSDPVLLKQGLQYLQKAKQKGHADPHLDYWLAHGKELTGDTAEALQSYQSCLPKFIHKDPEMHLQSILGLGRSAVEEGHVPQSLPALEDAGARYPTSIPLHILLSQAHLEVGNLDKAAISAEKAAQLDPKDETALEQVIQTASKTEAWETAMRALDRYVEDQSQDADAWRVFSEHALTAGRIDRARDALAQALHLDDQTPAHLGNAAGVLFKLGRPSFAKRLLERAIQADPENPSLLRKMAEAAERVGEIETAQKAWAKSAELDPENAGSLTRAAEALWRLNQREMAIDLWHRAHQQDQENPEIVRDLAIAYMAYDDTEKGLTLFQEALSIQPRNVYLLLEASRAMLRAGELEKAFRNLKNALRISPNRNDVLFTLADCLLEQQRPDQAEEVLKSIRLKEAKSPLWYALLSRTKLQKGELSSAEEIFEEGVQKTIKKDVDRVSLARTALALGKWDQALNLLKPYPSKLGDPDLILSALETLIRAAEVRWLYLSSDAYVHAPPDWVSSAEGKELIRTLLEAASHLPVYSPRFRQLELRAQALSRNLRHSQVEEAKKLALGDNSGHTLEAFAISLVKSGQPQRALEMIALRDDLNCESPFFDLIAGLSQLSQNQLLLARQAFDSIEGDARFRPLAQFLSAKTWLLEAEPAKAKSLLNSAISAWPEEHAWQYKLGSLYMGADEMDAALPHLQQAVEQKPKDGTYLTALARVLHRTGHLSQAYATFEQALKTNPSDGQTWNEAGSLALATGNPARAKALFDRACILAPSNPECMVGSAKALLLLGESRQALEKARSAMRMAPESPQVLMTIGEILAQQGKYDQALENYDRAIARSKDPIPIQIARSRLLVAAGRASEAVTALEQDLEEAPERDELWAAYAETHEALDQIQDALKAVKKALHFAPNHFSYRLLLARLSRKAGQLDRALDELSQLEQSDPINAAVLLELGQVYEDRRQYGKALQHYQRATQSDPGSAAAFLRAGIILKQLKAYQDAGDMLKRAVEINPQDADAMQQLAAVRALELVHGGFSQTAVTP